MFETGLGQNDVGELFGGRLIDHTLDCSLSFEELISAHCQDFEDADRGAGQMLALKRASAAFGWAKLVNENTRSDA